MGFTPHQTFMKSKFLHQYLLQSSASRSVNILYNGPDPMCCMICAEKKIKTATDGIILKYLSKYSFKMLILLLLSNLRIKEVDARSPLIIKNRSVYKNAALIGTVDPVKDSVIIFVRFAIG